MKKTFKTLALAGALVCSSVGLVACGGDDKALVDVQGNYVAASETKVNADEYLAKLDNEPEGQNYKISMRMDMDMSNADLGMTGKMTMKGVGHVSEVDGFDLSFSASASMKAQGVSANQKYDIKAYYDLAENRVYTSTNENGQVEKFYYDVADSDSAGAVAELPFDEGYITVNGIKNAITELGLDTIVSVCETEENVKIKYEGENGTFYIVFDAEGGFVGARCEFSVDMTKLSGGIAKIVTEVVRSDEKVVKLTDAEKAQYSKSTEMGA